MSANRTSTRPAAGSLAAIAGGLVTAVAAIFVTTGCDTMSADIEEAFKFDQPSPSEAASWMFHRDSEKRRLGISLIANAPFGGEPPYMEVYREAVIDTDPMVRAAAALALGLHGEPVDAERLVALLTDDSAIVRVEAAQSLQRLHNPVAIGPLLDRLRNDTESDVRMAAANALGQYAEPRVVEGLIAALDDESLAVNHHARRSLRFLTGKELGLEPEEWLAWYRASSDPFGERTAYTYPVYQRDLSWFEQIWPFSRPYFEDPARPVGLPPELAEAKP
ncbi:MAG: HEAT repeat domain-containing protein [Phycisphaerales bacterium]